MATRRMNVLSLLWSLLTMSALPCLAQTTGGSLAGRVTDETGQPLPGVSILVSGPKVQGVQTAATGLDGIFMVPFLPVGGGYELRVEAPGYGTVLRKGIEIPLGVTVNLPFVVGKGQAEVVVTAAAPLVDTRQTEIGASVPDRLINSLPLARGWDNTAFLAPGAVPSGMEWLPVGTPSINGSSGAENLFTVDGVDQNSMFDGVNFTALNNEFIEAVEVRTGGVDAEYGGFMGGAVNGVTKSGGNEFHGGVFAYYYDDGLGAASREVAHPGIVNLRSSFKQYDVGASLGGYFIKDKLWFFAAYDYNKTEVGYRVPGADPLVTLNGEPARSWAHDSGYTETITDPQYAFKLTWNVSPNHKLAFSWFGDDREQRTYEYLNGLSPIPSPAVMKTNPYSLTLQWNATWTARFFTEAALSRMSISNEGNATNPETRSHLVYRYSYGENYNVIPTAPPSAYDPATGRIDLASWKPSLGGMADTDTHDQNDELRAKATWLFDATGRHELSFGLQASRGESRINNRQPGPVTVDMDPELTDPKTGGTFRNPFYGHASYDAPTVWWSWDPGAQSYLYMTDTFFNGAVMSMDHDYYAGWVQDNWNLTDAFMLKLGLRWERNRMRSGERTFNAPGVLDPRGGPEGPYYDGQGRSIPMQDEWSPRVGFTWDVAHNGKSKLYGFYGIYYERPSNIIGAFYGYNAIFHYEWFADAALTQPVGACVALGLYPGKVEGGPEGGRLKGSYTQESLLGFQYEVKPELSLGARVIYRDLGRAIEDISPDGGLTFILTNPDQWTDVWIADYQGRPGYRWRYPQPVRRYEALELTADKRFSNRWSLQASYTLSRLEGNAEGLYSNDYAGTLMPNVTGQYDLPELLYNSFGPLPNDRTHVVKVFGSYFFENIPLELSGRFTLMSGTPISKRGAHPAVVGLPGPFLEPRGSAGRTPTVWSLDVGLQYTFKLGKSGLAVRADIFNLTDQQVTTQVDQWYNYFSGEDVQTNPNFGREIEHQPGRRVRLALRWTF